MPSLKDLINCTWQLLNMATTENDMFTFHTAPYMCINEKKMLRYIYLHKRGLK